MIRNIILIALLMGSSGLSWGASANGFSLLEYELQNLDTLKIDSLKQFQGKLVFISFFKPECSWCIKQLRALGKVSETHHDHIQALAVGINGRRMDLQKVLNRSNVHYPSYKATPELINTIGGVDFTPYTLVTDTEGNFITKLPGYADQEKLIQIINVIRS